MQKIPRVSLSLSSWDTFFVGQHISIQCYYEHTVYRETKIMDEIYSSQLYLRYQVCFKVILLIKA